MPDIERSIIPGIEFVRIKRSGSTQSIRIRIYVEITFYRALDKVCRRCQRARRPLLSVGCISDDVQGDVIIEQLLGSIEQCSISVHFALDRPARIDQRTQRRVVAAFLRTGSDADRVAVLHCRTEQFLEPVRIAHLVLAQVCFPSGFSILHEVFSCCRVICIHQLGHLAVNTALRVIHAAGEIEPALLVHFLIN